MQSAVSTPAQHSMPALLPCRSARRFFQVPKRLLEALAADGLGGAGAGEEGEDDELLAFEEDDSELVFDDVGPEVG